MTWGGLRVSLSPDQVGQGQWVTLWPDSESAAASKSMRAVFSERQLYIWPCWHGLVASKPTEATECHSSLWRMFLKGSGSFLAWQRVRREIICYGWSWLRWKRTEIIRTQDKFTDRRWPALHLGSQTASALVGEAIMEEEKCNTAWQALDHVLNFKSIICLH